ncbi:hypothetical protein F5I97DRAFT_1814249 [Phlebopus sp. FC_14]|nr:hypothetical protein F5I97DRAFT_1814249 [Phlebopus sp. FC_14]
MFPQPPSPSQSTFASYSFPAAVVSDDPAPHSFPDSAISAPSSESAEHPVRDAGRAANRITIAHPYARLYAKKDGSKRRKIWNHVLEKQLFSPQELSTMGAPHRRTIYIASLEAHIDRLHNQLLSIGLYPIPFERLEPYRGLNSKTAKSMVAGLQHDATHTKLKLLELERSVIPFPLVHSAKPSSYVAQNTNLRKLLGTHNSGPSPLLHTSTPSAMSLEADVRRHSVDVSGIGMGTHTGHTHLGHLLRP